MFYLLFLVFVETFGVSYLDHLDSTGSISLKYPKQKSSIMTCTV